MIYFYCQKSLSKCHKSYSCNLCKGLQLCHMLEISFLFKGTICVKTFMEIHQSRMRRRTLTNKSDDKAAHEAP